ncbi:MAG: penicillin-binding transpeptidase domain-containing protein [Bdellovibrionaceae bacterium]|nr:penicillin-binding transpeptidase domain-containing protein [Pseudobdellovibrionaceae bacterium]
MSLFCLLKLTLFCLILGQGGRVQLMPNKRLDAYKETQFFKTVTVQARRGSIYDRKEKELAMITPTYSLFADPQFVNSPRYAARKIAKHLGVNATVLEKRMRKKTRFVWLKRRLPMELKKEIESYGIKGLYFVGESHRRYPEQNGLSQTIGFVGAEGKGLEGLEYAYNEYLEGKDVVLQVSKDAKGRPLFMEPERYTQPPEGKDLILTADSEFQHYLEMELKKVYEEQGAKKAIGLILDVETGGIRAAGVWPSYDLNNARNVKPQVRINSLFQESMEQGSVIKPFAVAAALENQAYSPNSAFACLDGKIKVGKRTIKDSSKKDCETMTLTQGLAVSSNVVFTQLAQGLSKNTLRDFYKKVGFGQKTEIDFPGESTGLFYSKTWPEHMNISASFGHGFTASPIQVAAAYAAVANNGIWKQPHLVDRMIDPTGLDVKIKRQEKRVMTESTAKKVRMMLTSVVQDHGSGKAASVNGYLVAGKTGTAHKVDLVNGGYHKDKYFSSFVGMVPAGKPKFVIYIGVDEPTKDHYGSKVAAPVFSKVARFALSKEGVSPEVIQEENLFECKDLSCEQELASKTPQEPSPHSLKGLTLREALNILRQSEVDFDIRGQGVVRDVDFINGKEFKKGNKVKITLSAL